MTLQLTYRTATLKEFEALYLIKCDKANIQWGGFSEAPNTERFYEWFKAQLELDKRTIYLVYDHNSPCAFFYIDKVDEKTMSYLRQEYYHSMQEMASVHILYAND